MRAKALTGACQLSESSGGNLSAIFSTFDAVADIFERRYIEGSVPQTEERVLVLKDVPCAISRARVGSRYGHQPIRQSIVPELSFEIKLFVMPDTDIKAGSEIVVTHLGKSTKYISCGDPVRYKSHAEILLSREDYA